MIRQQQQQQQEQRSSSHLPVLYNPLLNCIFNNPHHSKAPFKRTIEDLSTKHNQYTILLPPAYILNEFHDPASDDSSTKVLIKTLCYNNEDFIRSHILKTGAPVSSTVTPISKEQLIIYNTMNGKQILIKNQMIYTGKGFKRSLKLKITSVLYFKSFCDYFPKGSQFMIIHIESSLIGGSPPFKPLPSLPPPPVSSSSSTKPENVANVTFEKLLRNFPLLSKAVSDKFYRLFHHNNRQFHQLRTRTRKKLSLIKGEFTKMQEEAYKIILDSVRVENPNSEQTYNLLNHIVSTYPELDLNKLVHEYVEINLYDLMWSQMIFQFNYPNDDKQEYDPEAMKYLTASKYESLSCLSLNQLDLPVSKPWLINELHQRIYLAIQEFKKLSDSSVMNLTVKTSIVYKTMEILSQAKKGSELVVDADTLIGLLVMTVVHAKIDNIEAHVYYIKNFNAIDRTNDGQFNYIISNLDAVICHLSESDSLQSLAISSQENFDLWSGIVDQDVEKVKQIVSKACEEYLGTDLPAKHCLLSKNINGESVIDFAIKAKNYEIYNLIINTSMLWFSIDFVLFDKNVISNQNLFMTALIEETDDQILDDLLAVVTQNATICEQVAYFNTPDNTGRTIGHYLFHNHHLITRIGHLIDWEIKDHNSHTPLFSLCRCYDHPSYPELLEVGFNAVYKKYGKKGIDFDKHMDKSGNTLLHIILMGLPQTQILSKEENLVNLNSTNAKNLTPLMLYVKYSRLENLCNILKDDRLDFLHEDHKTFYNVFDYLSFVSTKSSTSKEYRKIERLIVDHYFQNFFPANRPDKLAAFNGKFDSNLKEWVIHLRNEDCRSKPQSLRSIKQVLYVEKLQRPMSIFPDADLIWRNHAMNVSTSPMFQKLRINKLIAQLNVLFQSMMFQNDVNPEQLFTTFLGDISHNLSVLEQKQVILAVIESQKQDYGQVKLKFSNIQEMEFFLDFSFQDVKKHGSLFNKFAKLVCIGEHKQLDLRNVEDLSMSRINERAFFSKMFNIPEYHYQQCSLGALAQYVVWLDMIGDELLKHFQKIHLDVNAWKKLYHEICNINLELRSMEPTPETNVPNGVPQEGNHQGEAENLHRTGTNSSLFSTSTHTHAELIPDESEGLNLFGLGSSKRNRYKKLVVSKADLVKQIMKLNIDLKWEYEIMATQISNFLTFRTQFLKFGLSIYVKEEIRCLKQRQLELSKYLYRVKYR